jgi:hypothetical protein
MRYNKYIFILIIILGIALYMSFNQGEISSENIDQMHLENSIIEPKLYAKLDIGNIEISAKSARNDLNKVTLNEISVKLYQHNQAILADLTAQIGVFDIESKVLTINQGLSVRSEKLHIESASCKMNNNSIVFYKPKVEIL